MFHQRVSEICFEDRCVVESGASGELAAMAEGRCLREMRLHVEPTEEVVVEGSVELDQRRPVAPGTPLRVRGWVEQIGDRSARFLVRLGDDQGVVAELRVTLRVVDRAACIAARDERDSVAASAATALRLEKTQQRLPARRLHPSFFSSRAASSAK